MRTKTWKDKTTDVSNYWLSATRSEDDGLFQEAAVFYLQDAQQDLARGYKTRAGLSAACAASCIEKTGGLNMARHLYFEAARLYEEQADASLSTSLREGLWLLQEAHDYYVLGGDQDKANQVYDACVSLARKLNPFAASDDVSSMLRVRNVEVRRAQSPSIQAAPQASDVNEAVEEFLRLRESTSAPIQVKAKSAQRRPSVEKSIAS